MERAFDPNLTGGHEGGGLYFGGDSAKDTYGGKFVPLYTPSKWDPGSSMGHLDDDTGANQKMMNAATD